ncbi:nitroreductase [Streptomyces sp. NPDC093109]|uniref:nitroreductase n=1 Tax=Streptomyces sp. NPDC093109 TaxID=3154977 RepID=UPI00344B3907
MSGDTLPFADAVRARHAVRAFLPDPLPAAQIRGVLEDARMAPSNCNTQPWQIHIVSGRQRDLLSEELLRAEAAGEVSGDFTFDQNEYFGPYAQRSAHQAKTRNDALGIARSDREARRVADRRNFAFFGAPHVALLFAPVFGDGVRVGGDIGMYAQTFLLSLAARGLGGIPQTVLGLYAGTVREVLNVPDDLKLFFGISFGHEDHASPDNSYRLDRVPPRENVITHGTPGLFGNHPSPAPA